MRQNDIVAVALVFIVCTQASAQTNTVKSSESLPALIAVSASEDANGVTQADFNLSMLKDFEQRTLSTIRKKTIDQMRSQGDSSPPPKIRSEAHYLEAGRMKLAVVRLISPGSVNQVYTFGIVGSELRRVACVRTENFNQSIPVFSGPCGEKIRQTYNVTLQSK